MTSAILHAVETEREELDWVLASGALGRSTNLTRMLGFICERHFEGRSEDITEYRVAVEALGRRSDFDPHTDTIVRVTTHLLRKRLQEIYQGEGAIRPVRIMIPPGNYIPSFVPNEYYVDPEGSLAGESEPPPQDLPLAEPVTEQASGTGRRRRGQLWVYVGGAIVLAALILLILFVVKPTLAYWHRVGKALPPPIALPIPPDTVRALIGTGRKTYVDRSGNTWKPSTNCSGGTNVSVPSQKIAGTADPDIYLGGVRGITHCTFPVEPGMHEVRLFFAETSELEPARRKAVASVNAEPDVALDVVDAAGGTGIAVSRIWTGVRAQSDGTIHIDYTSEVSLLNAVEILPAPSDAQLPVRIVAADAQFTDAAGQVWQSDRDFIGGRRGDFIENAKKNEIGVFYSDRIGRMRYTIPVLPGVKYRVRLYFRETWFGRQDGGRKAEGRRVFDVLCNGAVMLKDFDISAQGNGEGIVKTLDHISGSPEGQIEIYLRPIVNYPLINAIEITPEG